MPNPIDSENVIAWLNAQIEKVQGGWLHDYGFPTNVIAALTDVKRFVKNLPTIEPEEPTIEPEVRHGDWNTIYSFDGDVYFRCSNCEEEFVLDDGNPKSKGWKYCPSCGCKMDGGAEQ